MPPTDNLYKFIAISGVIAYLFACSMATKQFMKYREDNFKLKNDSVAITTRVLDAQIMVDFLKTNLIIKYRLEPVELETIFNDSIYYNKKVKAFQCDSLYNSLLIERNKFEKENALLRINNENLKDPKFFINKSVFIAYWIIIFASFLIAWGFVNWYIKVHIPNMKALYRQFNIDYVSKTYERIVNCKFFVIGIGTAFLFILPLFALIYLSF